MPAKSKATKTNASKEAVSKKPIKKFSANLECLHGIDTDSTLVPVQVHLVLNNTVESEEVENINAELKYVSISADSTDVLISIDNFVDAQAFVLDIEKLRCELKARKVSMKGNVFVMYRRHDNEEKINVLENGYIKVSAKKVCFETCSFNITVKNAKKEGGKKYTEAEKMELFKEFYESEGRLPSKEDVYKEFKVGAFYNTAIKNKNTFEQLESIVKDVDGGSIPKPEKKSRGRGKSKGVEVQEQDESVKSVIDNLIEENDEE